MNLYRNFILFIILGTVFLMLSSCSPNNPQLKHLSSPVTLKAEPVFLPNNKISIKGTTNLPDGTTFLIKIISDVYIQSFTGGLTVSEGTFKSLSFGGPGGVKPGKYKVLIEMDFIRDQPESVIKAIGERGEFLSGPLVVKNTQFDDSIVSTVEKEFYIKVGLDHEIQSEEKRFKTHLSTLYYDLESFIKEGIAMEWCRGSNDLAEVKICSDKRRELQPKVKRIDDEAMIFSSFADFPVYDLRLASKRAFSCVSTAISSLESCADAKDNLQKVKEKMSL